jgi:drug/metabolite transporter (DMT)-like permease
VYCRLPLRDISPMDQIGPVILPLLAALLYVFGALLVKRSGDFGVGLWRTAFVSNLTSAMIFQLLLPLGGAFRSEFLWQPALLAVLFLLAQLLNYLALDRGDVSVATPVLGLKIILVALFTTVLLTQGVSGKLWAAAALSSAAIVLLNRAGGVKHHHVGSTILYAGMSAAAFALFDVLVQKWSPAWGQGRFLPAMFWFVAVFNVVLIPFFRAPLSTVPKPGWPWLLSGCALIGTQSLVFVMVIVKFRNATATNVVYSSRGLWSVLVVWAIGHWFSNREQHLGSRVLRWRLAGAVLMMTAIALAMT